MAVPQAAVDAGPLPRAAALGIIAAAPPGSTPPARALPPGAMGVAALLGIQRLAGNQAAAILARGMSSPVRPEPRALGGGDGSRIPAPVGDGAGGPPGRGDKLGGPVQRTDAGEPDDAREVHGSSGSGGQSPAGQPPAAKTEEPAQAGEAAQPGGGRGPDAMGAEGDGGGAQPRKVDAAGMDEQTAGLVADFVSEFGPQLGEVKGPAARLLDPAVRSAAARLAPDRRELVAPDALQSAPRQSAPRQSASRQSAPRGEERRLQRSAALVQCEPAVQRGPEAKAKIPVQKVKVTLPEWPQIPLFKDRNVGSWFLLSGVVESPAWEGEAKPPDDIRDDTTEQELQLTADGKVKGYAATLHKETLAKTGNVELEGKVAVEVTDESVKVSGLSLKLPDLGGSSNILLEGQFDFDLLDWPAGEPPGVMVLSYTQKIGVKSGFTTDGWALKGQLSLPLKVSIKPNPVKVAEYVARVIGPRLAAAAPAGLAIGAPLVAGGVCMALWLNAIKTGEDMAVAMDAAKFNTLGYVTAYFNTIMGYKTQRYSNAGSAEGTSAAQKVLDGLRWSELPEGAQEKVRAEYIKEGTMDLAGVQASMWKQYRAAAIAAFREEHSWDAWAYDKGLPSDLNGLIHDLDIVGPPWPVSAY